jgi:SpoVK/Ycf46/Vps4 family AAA+-type ATPase
VAGVEGGAARLGYSRSRRLSHSSRSDRENGGTSSPVFLVEEPTRTLDDLVVSDSVRRRIDIAVSVVKYHDILYNEWNLRKLDPHRKGFAINIYGPSGTGKTLCAEALAHHFGRQYISVSYAEIESRYVGETPKNIVRCFSSAREHDAVLIFNEADSILGSRLSDVTQSADHSVNVSRAVMLTELDHFDGFVAFTSNFAENYDRAFVRRILAHVRFELPDLATRERLWTLLLPQELPQADDVDAHSLAVASDGLAGGDIVNVIIAAAARTVTRPTEEQVVSLVDLQHEIDAARQAAREVGKYPGRYRPSSVTLPDAATENPGSGSPPGPVDT